MAYAGFQGIYTKSPMYRHRDGSVSTYRPESIIVYHDDCAHKAFNIDTSKDGWGSWHHDKGLSWHPGPYGAGEKYSLSPALCEFCGEPA